MRYHQPTEWTVNADYTTYIQSVKINDENKRDYLKAKNTLSKIPKLGAGGIDELLLKLASFINQS